MRPSARLRSWSRAPAVALHPCTRRGSLGSAHAVRRSLSTAPTAEPTLLISRDEERGIVTVAPNRPAKKNAIDRAMWAEVGTVLAELDRDDAIRCVVPPAAGRTATSRFFAPSARPADCVVSEIANGRQSGRKIVLWKMALPPHRCCG